MVYINLVCSFVLVLLVDEQTNSMVVSSDSSEKTLLCFSMMEETIDLLKEVFLNRRTNVCFLDIENEEKEKANDRKLTRSF